MFKSKNGQITIGYKNRIIEPKETNTLKESDYMTLEGIKYRVDFVDEGDNYIYFYLSHNEEETIKEYNTTNYKGKEVLEFVLKALKNTYKYSDKEYKTIAIK
jgi:hypothetical protein